MRIPCGLVILLCLLTVPARADEASKRAKVRELFTLLHINEMSDQITSTVRRQMDASMQSLPGVGQMTPEGKKLVDSYQSKVVAMVNDAVGWKVLEPQIVDLYASTYSEAEVDGILGFYKSPIGQSMLARTPELTRKSLAITQTKLKALQPQIDELTKEFTHQYAAAQAPPKSGSGVQSTTPPPK